MHIVDLDMRMNSLHRKDVMHEEQTILMNELRTARDPWLADEDDGRIG